MRENSNTIFKSEKLEKLDEIVYAVNELKINSVKYYDSNTVTASDTQINIKHNPETVIYTSNRTFEINKLPDHLCLVPANKLGYCIN